MKKLLNRKPNRLKSFDYSSNGIYFITICTKDKKSLLGTIVGDGVLDVPQLNPSKYGVIVEKRITEMNDIYEDLFVEKYVVMPNHLHLLIRIDNSKSGSSGTPTPTNSSISKFVSTLKRFTNKECELDLWQRSYYDHIIRNENDYLKIWEYIDSNTQKWKNDKYYTR